MHGRHEKSKGRDSTKKLGVDRIILKLILGKLIREI